MTISGAFHNISNDGLNFTRVQDINSDATHSWIGNYMINDTNELRFYGSGMNVWFSSSPNGGEWSAFNSTNIQGGDPSVLRLSSNDYLMIYTGQPYAVNIQVNGNSVPDKFELYQNYPNPFNPVTHLEFGISDWGFVLLKVYDVLGNEVRTLVNENKPAGRYEVIFNGEGLPSGVYFYKLVVRSSNTKKSGDFRDIKRMVLVK
ncbi:MAG: T9SS type A sorting domain-containing protein [Ignavibacteria bacterium]|nr:T9SS type A sorting domain-containing protein [Ignavibacteria bacterium]